MGGDTDNTQAMRTDTVDVHHGVSKQNSNHTLQKVQGEKEVKSSNFGSLLVKLIQDKVTLFLALI